MRFYTEQRRFYCGIDLHARMMYVCILSQEGEVVFHKNLPAAPKPFLEAIAPFRDDLVVGAECMFTWYWVADLCAREGIEFVLGHALYMKAIHGAKVKNDRVDLQAHIQNTNAQYNLPEFGKAISRKAHRKRRGFEH